MGSRVAIKIGCFASSLKIDMADTNSLIVINFHIKKSSQKYKIEKFQNIRIINIDFDIKINHPITRKKLIRIGNASN